MPMPSVEPMPLPPRLLRFAVPDEAQDASYFAASARIASRSMRDCWGICSLYVLITALPSAALPFATNRWRGTAAGAERCGNAMVEEVGAGAAGEPDAHDRSPRRDAPLCQVLGRRPAGRADPRLAAFGRQLGPGRSRPRRRG